MFGSAQTAFRLTGTIKGCAFALSGTDPSRTKPHAMQRTSEFIEIADGLRHGSRDSPFLWLSGNFDVE